MSESGIRPKWLDEHPEKSSGVIATSLACPHLGMRNEPGIYLAYPSPGNRCYRCRRPATPALAHQETFCLRGAQRDCPAFKQAQRLAFPAELREPEPALRRLTISTAWLLVILFVLILIGFAEWWFFPRVFTFPGARPSPSASTGFVPFSPVTSGAVPNTTPGQTGVSAPVTG